MENTKNENEGQIHYSFFLDKKSEKKYKKYLKDHDSISFNLYSYVEFKKGEIIEIQLSDGTLYADVKIMSVKKQFLNDTVGQFFGISYHISIIKIK